MDYSLQLCIRCALLRWEEVGGVAMDGISCAPSAVLLLLG